MDDDEPTRFATRDESVREWAYNCGSDPCRVDRQWLLHDYDVWVRNPHYQGPAQGHPEDYNYDTEAEHPAAADGSVEEARSLPPVDDDDLSDLPF
jgi:hypothetical protein